MTTDPDAATTAATIQAGMRGLDEHFHAEHDDEDSVEECCIAAVIEAAGFADTYEAYEDGRKDRREGERERIRLRLLTLHYISPDISQRLAADLLDGGGDEG